ncbi:MAG: hypothetical protein Q7R66_14635 [Undibacterium sp.]|nr:hypothetical protein [Undibacterium sp.]MDO8653420.1 hypothetical protein [Undibacterium sp.]
MRVAEVIGWKPAWDMRERGGAVFFAASTSAGSAGVFDHDP